jgi:nicotinamidase/pyrazinamidase
MSNNIIYFDIDTQRDFMLPGGALYVPGAEGLVPVIKNLTEFADKNNITILSSTDNHTEDDPEFAQWPPHCIVGTPGQEKIPESLLESAVVLGPEKDEGFDPSAKKQVVLGKPTLDMFDNLNTESILSILKPDIIYVYGVVTEYCVRLAALGALERGYHVAVITDAIKEISDQEGAVALAEIMDNGGTLVTSGEILNRQ